SEATTPAAVPHRPPRLPRLDGSGQRTLLLADVAEIQVRGCRVRIHINRCLESPRGACEISALELVPGNLVVQERENGLIFATAALVDGGNALADAQRVRPLMLFLVKLLEVNGRVGILWV